jgi:hypothetical protein
MEWVRVLTAGPTARAHCRVLHAQQLGCPYRVTPQSGLHVSNDCPITPRFRTGVSTYVCRIGWCHLYPGVVAEYVVKNARPLGFPVEQKETIAQTHTAGAMVFSGNNKRTR